MTVTKGLVPPVVDLIAPMFDAVRESSGPAENAWLTSQVVAAMNLSPEALSIAHDEGRSELDYRADWARTYLSLAGVITNVGRGKWMLADDAPKNVNGREIVKKVRAAQRAALERRAPLEKEANTLTLADDVAATLRQEHDELRNKGLVRSAEELSVYYERFRDRFGPRVLASLDGEALLEGMHGRGTKESLVYWLEFKDDEEMPDHFGGIGGGSALKFGLYKAKETQQWMTGSPAAMKAISVADAVAIARQQRDWMLAAVRVLEAAEREAPTVDYDRLQTALDEATGGLGSSGWVHKYLALLFPRLLDDFHALAYQSFHLIKLRKAPARGIYANAGFFSAIARQVGVPISSLATTLYERNGRSMHGYWRVGTTVGNGGQSEWARMRAGNFIAVGWDRIPALVGYDNSKAQKQQLTALMQKHYPSTPQAVGKAVNELASFVALMAPRDLVVAMQGGTKVLGVGRITGDYFHQPSDGPFPHRRTVEWLDTDPWELFDPEGKLTTVYRFDRGKFRYPLNAIAIEQRAALPGAIDIESIEVDVSDKVPSLPPPAPPLTGLVARVERALERKGQLILYGPPGTGKTYWALRAARTLVARSWFGLDWDFLSDAQRGDIEKERALETCCFHPSFGYEDFVEGLRPKTIGGQLGFEPRPGAFKAICSRAAEHPTKRFILVIDEINRGDTPRIFGELLLTLEKDKRGLPVRLPLTGDILRVPANLHVIGTMNTADRSIALLDAALRRRFGFIELLPDGEVLAGARVLGLPVGPWLAQLNARVRGRLKRDARNLQIGHSYFLHDGSPITDGSRFAEVLRDDVIPLLEEYFYEDFDALAELLGTAIIKRDEQRIEESLFKPGNAPALVDALKKAYADIFTSLAAAESEAAATADEQADDESDDDDGSKADA